MTNFADAYIQRSAEINAIIEPLPSTIDELVSLAADNEPPQLSELVLTAIQESNADLLHSPIRKAHLQALTEHKAVPIVVCLQVGLFGGSLCTLYKALTTVTIAQQLSDITNLNFVPIFWLQNQDNCFEDINHAYIYNQNSSPTRLHIPTDNQDAHSPLSVGYQTISSHINNLMNSLKDAIEDTPFSTELLTTLNCSYQEGVSFSSAFKQLFDRLLHPAGVIFFNPCTPAAAQATKAIYQQSLTNTDKINNAITKRCEQLSSRGFEERTTLRNTSPLFYVHTPNPSGPRYRLERQNGGYSFIGRSGGLTAEELDDLLEAEPQRFSPCGLLRVIIQDALLQPLAQVTSRVELNHIAQLAPLYDIISVKPSIPIPRASFQCLEKKQYHWLKDIDIEPSDLLLEQSALLHKLSKKPDSCFNKENIQEKLNNYLLELTNYYRQKSQHIDPALSFYLDRTLPKLKHYIGKLSARYDKASAKRASSQTNKIAKLQNCLYPDKIEQELMFSAVYYLAKYGPAFIETIIENIVPLDGTQHLIKLQ